MFESCTSLKTALLEDGVTVIGERAFFGCTALNSVELKGLVGTIEERAFYGGTALTKVNIPHSVTLINREAFSGCTALYRVIMESRGETEPLIFEDTVFTGCTSIKEIEFVEGVERIGARIFEGCENLNTVIVPKSMKKMGERAFNGCQKVEHFWYRGTLYQWQQLAYKDSPDCFKGSNINGSTASWNVMLKVSYSG
jgi:hypothetical protein